VCIQRYALFNSRRARPERTRYALQLKICDVLVARSYELQSPCLARLEWVIGTQCVDASLWIRRLSSARAETRYACCEFRIDLDRYLHIDEDNTPKYAECRIKPLSPLSTKADHILWESRGWVSGPEVHLVAGIEERQLWRHYLNGMQPRNQAPHGIRRHPRPGTPATDPARTEFTHIHISGKSPPTFIASTPTCLI
jgi:hypothetical protein